MSERAQVAERAEVAYRALADLAETIEDEWQYVTDLADAYLPSIRAMGVGPEAGSVLTPEAEAAADEAIAEIALITDPHKAIDWLSTFPHVVALALDGNVDDDSDPADGADRDRPEPPAPEPPADHSPFKLLQFRR